MKKINDLTFGEINYNHGWVGQYSLAMFGEKWNLDLYIDGEEDEEFRENQRIIFEKFQSNKEEFINKAEKELFKYYKEICEEYRDRYEDEADKYAPIINCSSELKRILKPEGIIVARRDEEVREIGILFESTWEIEHGIAVRFVNEEVEEVGFQDIVL